MLPLRNGLERRSLVLEARRLREERAAHLLELAFEKSRLGTIINCMLDGVLVINRDRQIVLSNAAAAQILPGCADLALPAPLAQMECPEVQGALEGILSGGTGPLVASTELAVGDETYLVNTSPVQEEGGEAVGAVAVLRNITALKALETAKSMFVSMVAHEVKRPLGAVEGYLDLILSGIAGEDAERDRGLMQRALLRARTLRILVSELMALTAVETGNFVLKRAPLDVREVVAEAVEVCRERAEEKHLPLVLRTDESVTFPNAFADRGAMLTAFTNLIDNAVKYTVGEGRIEIEVARAGRYVTVAVRDTGIGMTEDEQACVFNEFYRANNRHTLSIPGTGLGLSLTKKLVDLHHGHLEVESTPGVGSTFTVRLPLSEQEAVTRP